MELNSIEASKRSKATELTTKERARDDVIISIQSMVGEVRGY